MGSTDALQGGPIEILGRTFDVLDAFCQGTSTQLSLAEISRRSALPKSTTHRILSSLVCLGAVERCGQAYRLGLRMFEIGEHAPRKRDLREAALPFMEDLYEVTHETVHLAVLDRTEVLYIERIQGHHQQRQLASRVGGRMPAYCTAVGKALLAFTPDVAASVVAAGQLEARTPYTITSPRALVEELATVRRTCLSFDRDENAIGIHCVATPILVGGQAVAALSVTGPSNRISEERVGSAVRTAGLGLQRALGTAPALSAPPGPRPPTAFRSTERPYG